MIRFFLSVLTRHQQNTDCRTWSILKTSSGCWTRRHSEKGTDCGIYENILRNKSALLVEICITFTCFQTLRPRKRGFLHETGFSSTSIDTTLMVQVLPNRKSLDFDYLKSRQMRGYTYSRIPITRTFRGNRKRFELSGVRVTGS